MIGCDVFSQSIKVLDADSVPVAFVVATTEQGQLIGVTDVNGVMDDVKGNKVICLSHVAYKPLTVKVSDLTEGVVLLEEANYTIQDVIVKPKELLYVQTYYRVTYIDEDGPLYYRAGIIDNTYEFANKKLKTKSKNISSARNKLLQFLLNTNMGDLIEKRSRLQKESLYQLVESNIGKGAYLNIVTDSTGRKLISDEYSLLGYIDENAEKGTRAVMFDTWLFDKHRDIAKQTNETKKQKKQAKLEKEDEGFERNFYEVCRMDEDGNSSIGDFVKMRLLTKGVFKESGKKYIIILESFATEMAYIDKKEFKQTRKDNDVDKTYEDMLIYERNHNIPPLAPNLREQMDKLFKKK